MAGGKGKTSLQTPNDIVKHGEKHTLAVDPQDLVYASKISAKVDNTAVQDSYQLYHHSQSLGPPFPVDKNVYDQTIATLRRILSQAEIESLDKQKAFQRLSRFYGEEERNADNER